MEEWVKEAVHNEVRRHRFLHGEMTQEDLARRVGVTRQTIAAIERGNYDPSVSLALRIARVFGVALEEVFRLPDVPPWEEDERIENRA